MFLGTCLAYVVYVPNTLSTAIFCKRMNSVLKAFVYRMSNVPLAKIQRIKRMSSVYIVNIAYV